MTTVAEPRAADREVSPVLAFVGRRLLGAAVSLLVASVLIFIGTSVLPGNAASVVLGRGATPAAVQKLETQMHLNKPLTTQYTNWLGGFVHGDLGDSSIGLAQGQKHAPVWALISDPVKNSLILALITALFMIPLSLGLGAIAAVYAGRPADHAISIMSLAAIALPEFVTGSLLVGVFVVWLNVLPPVSIIPPGQSPLSDPTTLILPVVTLLLASLAAGIRMLRAGVVETMQADYVKAARLNGMSERRVLWRYALRNALAPTVQVLALTVQWLIGGVVVVETVFSYPGLGPGLVTAVGNRDLRVVQSVTLLIAVVYIVLNLVADLVVLLLVPKLREPA